MGVEAVGIGPYDYAGGLELLEHLGEEGMPFTAANLVDDRGQTIFPPYRLISVGPVVIAVVGISAEPAAELSGFAVLDGGESLARVLPEIIGSADIVVILASSSLADAAVLADRFADIDVIVTADGRRGNVAPFIRHQALMTQTAGQGFSVGALSIDWRGTPWAEPPAAALGRARARLKSVLTRLQRLGSQPARSAADSDVVTRLENERNRLVSELENLEKSSGPRRGETPPSTFHWRFIPIPAAGQTAPEIEALLLDRRN